MNEPQPYLVEFAVNAPSNWHPYFKSALVWAFDFEEACKKIKEKYPDAQGFIDCNIDTPNLKTN